MDARACAGEAGVTRRRRFYATTPEGTPFAYCGTRPLTPEDREKINNIIEAARRQFAAYHRDPVAAVLDPMSAADDVDLSRPVVVDDLPYPTTKRASHESNDR